MGQDAALTGIPDSNRFQIIRTGVINVTKAAGSGSGTAVLAHNLGYSPAFLIFLDFGFGFLFGPVVQDSGAEAGKVFLSLQGFATDFNLNVSVITPNVSGNSYYSAEAIYKVRYYLLREISRTD